MPWAQIDDQATHDPTVSVPGEGRTATVGRWRRERAQALAKVDQVTRALHLAVGCCDQATGECDERQVSELITYAGPVCAPTPDLLGAVVRADLDRVRARLLAALAPDEDHATTSTGELADRMARLADHAALSTVELADRVARLAGEVERRTRQRDQAREARGFQLERATQALAERDAARAELVALSGRTVTYSRDVRGPEIRRGTARRLGIEAPARSITGGWVDEVVWSRAVPDGPLRLDLSALASVLPPPRRCVVTVWLDGVWPTECAQPFVGGRCVRHG